MFLAGLRRSHSLRLATLVAGVTMALLALAFGGIVFWTRQDRLEILHRELAETASLVQREGLSNIDFDELREDHPGMTITRYSSTGALISRSGKLNAPNEIEFNKRDDLVWLGTTVGSDRVILAKSWLEADSTIKQLALILALLLIPFSLAAGVLTWLATRSVFRPINEIVAQVRKLESSGGERSLSVSDHAEFEFLVENLNDMLRKLDRSARAEERFIQDASHELRTPLAVLRAQIETTLLRSRSPEEYIESHRGMLMQVERLTGLANYLLITSKGPMPDAEPVDLVPLVELALDRIARNAQLRAITLHSRLEECSARILPIELAVVLNNVLENALRFSPQGANIEITSRLTEGGCELIILDSGPGIPPEFLPHAFERFAQSAPMQEGVGLGLAISRKIINARGGEIQLSNREDRDGTRCRIWFAGLD